MSSKKEEFLAIYKSKISRKGADALLVRIGTDGFFDAPASARHHLAMPGGLVEHSLNVYHRLVEFIETESLQNPSFNAPSDESVALVALLHDVCKAGCYSAEQKNAKTYDPEKVAAAEPWQVKKDNGGRFIWEVVESYRFDDPIPMGHGEKSLWIVQKYMDVSDEEAFAIRYHMGAWSNDGERTNAGKAFETYPLAFLLHMADEMATFLDERE